MDILADQHQPPRAVEHPQGKRALNPRHLILVQLHRIDRATPIFIITGERTKHTSEQNCGIFDGTDRNRLTEFFLFLHPQNLGKAPAMTNPSRPDPPRYYQNR